MAYITPRIFVSSTREDLNDCRKWVIKALRKAQSLPVAMEEWPAEYLPAQQICKQEILKSTHYLAILAFLYGSVPDGFDMSYTQLEYELASQTKLQGKVAFIPDITSQFSQALEDRAKQQSAEHHNLQQAFLSQVKRAGCCQTYSDITDLAIRAGVIAARWAQGGFLGKAREAKSGRRPRRPSVEDGVFTRIGRKAQVRTFQDTMDVIDAPIVGFVVHGKSGCGHDEMIWRLQNEWEQEGISVVKHLSLSLKPLWRDESLDCILRGLITQIDSTATDMTTGGLAKSLKAILKGGAVIMNLKDIQRYSGSIRQFCSDFWRPLIHTISEEIAYRCVCFISVREEINSDDPGIFNVPDAADDFSADRLVPLPELVNFTRSEMKAFLRKHLAHQDAAALLNTLLNETNGGEPRMVYDILAEELETG